MLSQWVWVPKGRSLVYKLAIEKFTKQCVTNYYPATTAEVTETRTYFFAP